MGVLKTLTDEYFGDSIREEDKILISDLDVEIVSFKDNNGVEYKHGYRVKDGDPNEMAKTLKTLIERIIEKRGSECSLNDIDVSNIKKMCYEKNGIYGVFEDSHFNGDVSGWDVLKVEDMNQMFYNAKFFNQPLYKWDVSSVKTMAFMFSGAESFNQSLDKWGDKLLKVKNMVGMFAYAKSFNQDISGWDVSNVENMGWMFRGDESFNQDISGWDVSSVKYMSGMFDYTPLKHNNKLPKWYRQ